MPAPALDPQRPYTPFQRREVVQKLAAKEGITIWEAADKFKTIEMTDLEGIAKLCAKFAESPKKAEG